MNRPDTNGSINGINAINFDKRSNNNMERIIAYKNGYGVDNWNPATSDGTTPGDVNDVFVMLIARLDTMKRNSFPFNFGWGDLSMEWGQYILVVLR